MFLRLPVIRVLGLFSPDQEPSALDHLGRTPDHQGENRFVSSSDELLPFQSLFPFSYLGSRSCFQPDGSGLV